MPALCSYDSIKMYLLQSCVSCTMTVSGVNRRMHRFICYFEKGWQSNNAEALRQFCTASPGCPWASSVWVTQRLNSICPVPHAGM